MPPPQSLSTTSIHLTIRQNSMSHFPWHLGTKTGLSHKHWQICISPSDLNISLTFQEWNAAFPLDIRHASAFSIPTSASWYINAFYREFSARVVHRNLNEIRCLHWAVDIHSFIFDADVGHKLTQFFFCFV